MSTSIAATLDVESSSKLLAANTSQASTYKLTEWHQGLSNQRYSGPGHALARACDREGLQTLVYYLV